MKKLLISNLASPANPGDQAILRGALKLLRSHYQGPEITVATRAYSQRSVYEALGCRVVPNFPNVEATATDSKLMKLMGLPRAFSGFNLLKSAVQDADLVFLIGGGYFYSYKTLLPGLTFLSHCIPVELAAKYNKRVILLPQSYGPLNSALANRLFHRVLLQCGAVFFREEISGEWLRQRFNESAQKSNFMPDLAVFLNAADLGIERRDVSQHTGIIGVTVRPWKGQSGDADAYLDELKEALVRLNQRHKLKLRIIVQVKRPTLYESDEQISRRLYESLIKEIPQEEVEFKSASPYFQLTDLCQLYAGCDLLIGMRLHSAILSAVAGCPPLVIGYQHKSEGIMKCLGLEDLYFKNFDQVKARELEEACEKILADRVTWINRIDKALEEARVLINKIFASKAEAV